MKPFRLQTRVVQGSAPRVGARGASGVSGALSAPEAPGAVRVPWRVIARGECGALEIEQCGAEPLRAVRFSLAGAGLLGLSLPRTVHPGERLRVVVRGRQADGARAAPDALLVLRWLQADGTELLWPIAL